SLRSKERQPSGPQGSWVPGLCCSSVPDPLDMLPRRAAPRDPNPCGAGHPIYEIASMEKPLSAELLEKMNAYWRASNYLSVVQIYLYDNPLLKKALKLEHVKPRLLGHWGTTPGLNFIYVHLNRII